MTLLAADHRRLLRNGLQPPRRPRLLRVHLRTLRLLRDRRPVVPVLIRQRDHATDQGQPDRARLFTGLLDNLDRTS